jgi:ABC-2 type transport system permease protein
VRVIYSLTARRTWVRIACLAVGLGLFELVVGLSYSSTDRALLKQLVDGLPPAVRALVSASGADVTTPSGYLGSGYFHPVALTLQIAAAISLAAGVARDVESGVAELILSRPISRWRWLAAQALWMLTALAAIAGTGALGGYLSTRVLSTLNDVSLRSILIVAGGGFLLAATIGMFAMLVAGLVRTGGRVVGVVSAFVLVAYALNYLSIVWGLIRPLGPVSPFHYYDPTRILLRGQIDASAIIVLGSLIIIFAAAALLVIEHRESAP